MAVRHILVVDDDPGIRLAIALRLRSVGFSTAEATDGVEAVEYFAAHQADLAVLDVGMPRMNGYEVACALHANPATRTMPIVILTAQDMEIPSAVRPQIGRHHFLTKPFSPRELVKVVMDLLGAEGT